MHPASEHHIPDGLLAAGVLLSEKPRHGVTSKNPALNQGINEANSTAAIGLRAGLLLNRVQSRYTGKERDTESGNDYFGARYYASSMGRFMSPDWSSTPEPVPYAKLNNPQSLNLYAYMDNNPLGGTDEDGHNGFTDFFEKLWNKLNGNGWYTNSQVTEQHRSYLMERTKTAADAAKFQNATPKQVNDTYGCWHQPSCYRDYLKIVANMAAAVPGGARNPAQDKMLSSKEIENLETNTGESAHEIKEGALGTNKNISKYDLYKTSDGEIVAKPKGSSADGEPTGYTTEHLQTPQK